MIKNNKFNLRLRNLPDKIWFLIVKIDKLHGQWIAGSKLHPHILGRLKKSVLITSTGSSTRIEGARLSDQEIERMLRNVSMQKFIDRDEQEVRGYYELLENLFNSWKNLSFNKNLIKHFHGELLRYVEKDQEHRGHYKKQENKVHMINKAGDSVGVLFDTTPAYLTPKEMQELIEWTQNAFKEKEIHPLLIIGNFVVEFLNIHPFIDGNGRLSRILTNFLLLKEGYEYVPYVSHEKLIEDNKPDYYLALRKSQKTIKTKKENIVFWLEFFLEILLKQSREAVDLLLNESIENILTRKQLMVWEYLESVDEASPLKISQETKVLLPTVRQTLNKLIKLKRVSRSGQGRGVVYSKIR